MATSLACPVHLALSDSLSIQALQRLLPLLLGRGACNYSADLELLQVSLQPLLIMCGVNQADVASLSSFFSPAAAAASTKQGTVPMDMEEVIDRLEVLSARLLGLQQDLTHEIQALRLQQVNETIPVLSAFQAQVPIVEASINRVRDDENLMREKLDQLSHITAKFKKSVQTAQDLAVVSAPQLAEDLDRHRDDRTQCMDDLEEKLMERNALVAQLSLCQTTIRILMNSDLDLRDYDRCTFEFENNSSCAEMFGQQQADSLLASVKLLLHYRETEFKDRRLLSDAHAALCELRAIIALMVDLYWK